MSGPFGGGRILAVGPGRSEILETINLAKRGERKHSYPHDRESPNPP